MTGGMFLASTSDSVTALCAWRLLTGLGIGGMLTAITAMTAETSPMKSRELFVALMTIGYPVGSVVGGAISASLLTHSDWRSVFLLGAGASAIILPLAFFFVAESPAFLAMTAKPGALEKLNAGLTKLGQAPLAALPPKIEKNKSPLDIFKPQYIGPTLLITIAYFAHVFAMYFLLKWTPKVVTDLGYATHEAAGVLVYANVGNAIGGALFGLTAAFLPLKPRTIFVIAMTGVMLSVFGRSGHSLTALTVSATAVGFFVTSGTAGLFTFFTRVFPSHLRTTGTGFVIGVGRGGGALSPIFAGFLFQEGLSFPVVATIMGCGSFLAAALLLMLNVKAREEAPAPA
jgi:MFS family permease